MLFHFFLLRFIVGFRDAHRSTRNSVIKIRCLVSEFASWFSRYLTIYFFYYLYHKVTSSKTKNSFICLRLSKKSVKSGGRGNCNRKVWTYWHVTSPALDYARTIESFYHSATLPCTKIWNCNGRFIWSNQSWRYFLQFFAKMVLFLVFFFVSYKTLKKNSIEKLPHWTYILGTMQFAWFAVQVIQMDLLCSALKVSHFIIIFFSNDQTPFSAQYIR